MSADWDPGHRLPIVPDEPPQDERRSSSGDDRDAPDAARLVWLVVGAVAIAGGTALGWDATGLAAIVTPPPLLRAALVGVAAGVGIVLILGAVNRLAAVDHAAGRATARDIGAMIRGVRLVFLAVAAFAAASGWLVGHPLPLVVALVIAGVDILETSFLLIVVGLRPRR
jgi:hypothetical protein